MHGCIENQAHQRPEPSSSTGIGKIKLANKKQQNPDRRVSLSLFHSNKSPIVVSTSTVPASTSTIFYFLNQKPWQHRQLLTSILPSLYLMNLVRLEHLYVTKQKNRMLKKNDDYCVCVF